MASPTEFEQAKRIFDQVFELAADQRQAFVKKACSNNRAVEAHVERMLAEFDKNNDTSASDSLLKKRSPSLLKTESSPQTRRVLVVDDDPTNREFLVRRLQRRGYTITTAASGLEALQQIDTHTFDLVLLDIMMPGMDGLHVLKQVRQKVSMADLPIVIASARHQSDDVIRALQLGANDYITKPMDFEVAVARIETHLSLKRLAAAQKSGHTGVQRIGRTISHFRIEEKIGVGGMGEVYRARDLKLGRVVAIKMLSDRFAGDDQKMRHLIREAKAASLLNHPNVATVYDVIEAGSGTFVTMEYIDGETLASRIQRGALSLGEIVSVGGQFIDALQEAHSHGIVHRDVKPSNIMINRKGLVKLLDFGLAKALFADQEEFTESGVFKGTLHYMSPEQISGTELDHRSDIFSAGVVLFEMSLGRVPFSGLSAFEIFHNILHSEPQFSAAIPENLITVIRRCLHKDLQRRYQSATELAAAVRSL
jgi:CheY-like chemotaxis protein